MRFIGLLAVLCATQLSADDLKFLDAIAVVETGRTDSKIGQAGERGRYQITEMVWKEHTDQPFTLAHDYQYSTKIALEHVKKLRARITRIGLHVDYPTIAYAWNCGPNARVDNNKGRDYARRVMNLYNEK